VSFELLFIVESEPVPLFAKVFSLLIVFYSNNSTSLSFKIHGMICTHNSERCSRIALKILS